MCRPAGEEHAWVSTGVSVHESLLANNRQRNYCIPLVARTHAHAQCFPCGKKNCRGNKFRGFVDREEQTQHYANACVYDRFFLHCNTDLCNSPAPCIDCW